MEEELTGVIWVTSRKEHLDLANMGDDHIINTFNFLVDNYPYRKKFINAISKEIDLRVDSLNLKQKKKFISAYCELCKILY